MEIEPGPLGWQAAGLSILPWSVRPVTYEVLAAKSIGQNSRRNQGQDHPELEASDDEALLQRRPVEPRHVVGCDEAVLVEKKNLTKMEEQPKKPGVPSCCLTANFPKGFYV